MTSDPIDIQAVFNKNLKTMKILTVVAGICGFSTIFSLIILLITIPDYALWSFLFMFPTIGSAIWALVIGNRNIALLKIMRRQEEALLRQRIREYFN